VQHERLRGEVRELLLRRVDEERLCEERVIRTMRDDPHRDPVLGIGAAERIDDVDDFLLLEIRDDLVT
jgi:hypothetical protein